MSVALAKLGPSLIRRDGLGHICPPDLIHTLGDYGPVMWVLGSNTGTMGCEQPIFLHDPSHPPRRRTDAYEPKPGQDLAVAFAQKGTGFDLCFNMNKQILIGASRRPMTLDSGA